MLFMYVHTHPVEKCPANKPGEAKKMIAWAQEAAKKAGVKMVGGYLAMHEHTLYAIFDASDIALLEQMLIPLTILGTAKLIPVITLEQTVAIAP